MEKVQQRDGVKAGMLEAISTDVEHTSRRVTTSEISRMYGKVSPRKHDHRQLEFVRRNHLESPPPTGTPRAGAANDAKERSRK